MRIGIDLDGCVYDYVDAMRRYLAEYEYADPERLPEPTEWDIWTAWDMDRDDFFRASAEGIRVGVVFGTGDPYPGAVEALDALVAAGHTLHIVTARRRQYRAISLTAGWLEQHRITYKSLTFSSDKTAVPVDVFVEDNVNNAAAIAAAGGHPVLLDRPWNRGAVGVARAYEWGDIVDIAGSIERTRKVVARRLPGALRGAWV